MLWQTCVSLRISLEFARSFIKICCKSNSLKMLKPVPGVLVNHVKFHSMNFILEPKHRTPTRALEPFPPTTIPKSQTLGRAQLCLFSFTLKLFSQFGVQQRNNINNHRIHRHNKVKRCQRKTRARVERTHLSVSALYLLASC